MRVILLVGIWIIQYPAYSRRMGIQGLVFLQMTIIRDAKIENIVVTDGIQVDLDKEAMRVMRKLQLATPPMLNGQPIQACVILPVKYKLAN